MTSAPLWKAPRAVWVRPRFIAARDGFVYAAPGAETYDRQHRTHVVRRLRQRAATLGFELVNRATGEVLGESVS